MTTEVHEDISDDEKKVLRDFPEYREIEEIPGAEISSIGSAIDTNHQRRVVVLLRRAPLGKPVRLMLSPGGADELAHILRGCAATARELVEPAVT